jgi:hypothetical protein
MKLTWRDAATVPFMTAIIATTTMPGAELGPDTHEVIEQPPARRICCDRGLKAIAARAPHAHALSHVALRCRGKRSMR